MRTRTDLPRVAPLHVGKHPVHAEPKTFAGPYRVAVVSEAPPSSTRSKPNRPKASVSTRVSSAASYSRPRTSGRRAPARAWRTRHRRPAAATRAPPTGRRGRLPSRSGATAPPRRRRVGPGAPSGRSYPRLKGVGRSTERLADGGAAVALREAMRGLGRSAQRSARRYAAVGVCEASKRLLELPGAQLAGGHARRAAQTVRSVRTARSSRRRMLRGLSASRSSSSAVRSSGPSAGAPVSRMRFRLPWA